MAWLTTLRPDGSPHTTPVWFVYRDASFWIASSAANTKVKNLHNDPRVSIAIDSSDGPHVAEGLALVRISFNEQPEIMLDFADKYAGWDASDPEHDGLRVLIEVGVTRWLAT